MPTVVVQRPARPEGGVPESWSLGPGDAVTVGRGSREQPVDVALRHPGVPRIAARIEASADFWLLTNHAHALALVAENPEGGGEFVRVGPGRSRAPIPFEFTRLSIPVEGGTVDLLVFAPEHDHGAAVVSGNGSDATVRGFSLDESAKYFRVLVALCEPRLRDPASAVLPSVQAIGERLAGMGRSAVGFHLEYLARYKLHVYEREDADGPDARLDERRHALARQRARDVDAPAVDLAHPRAGVVEIGAGDLQLRAGVQARPPRPGGAPSAAASLGSEMS
jgi:hypothetical protein